MLPVSYLFVPGNRPERFDKALAAGAGAIILDLEDAVAPADKDAARSAIAAWVAGAAVARERLVVRVNDALSPWYADDLALVRDAGITQVMLPKAEFAGQVAATLAAIGGNGVVLPLVETARGIGNVEQIALSDGVQRIAFGTLDYAVDLNLSGDERGLIYPYSRIAIASRSAELAAPIAGVTPSIDDLARTEADFAFARSFGFAAKMCIHPKQVEVVERLAMPTESEVLWARKVLAAAGNSAGAVQVDGKMVDRPVLLKAESILARSQASHRN
ncbi:HpcH/HpaI aldolase/citrate lyase family protein [Azospira restricta]|uniref:CoA ester lyase n=1 Tax=Azospira restricta TaxID=404405 RepID=A0A974PXP0_9RHOO|nr:CoA ester lyase [Azospira restricta]QRJ63300.1 CoA ester lyase [Azospira restricta]